MTLDQFATITLRVIAKEGFTDFQPTACYPERREIKTLAGLPSDINIQEHALEWASGSAGPDEEFLVAFKITGDRFRVIRREGPTTELRDYAADISSP